MCTLALPPPQGLHQAYNYIVQFQLLDLRVDLLAEIGDKGSNRWVNQQRKRASDKRPKRGQKHQ